MKNIFLTTLSILFFISVFAQKHIATLYLKDRKTIKGLAKISNEKVKFRTSKKSKKEWYDYKTLKGLKIKDFGVNVYHEFYYKNIDSSATIKLLELRKKGKISIYTLPSGDYGTSNVSVMFGLVGVGVNTLVTSNSINNIFLCENNSNTVVYFSNKKKLFKKETSEYFKDCPTLTNKINNNEFKRKQLIKIIDFYNHKCQK